MLQIEGWKPVPYNNPSDYKKIKAALEEADLRESTETDAGYKLFSDEAVKASRGDELYALCMAHYDWKDLTKEEKEEWIAKAKKVTLSREELIAHEERFSQQEPYDY